MESTKGFLDSFKEFVWDIIGYLLPGSYILILLSICVNKEYFIYTPSGTSTNDFSLFVFIIISYLLGHVAYGFGWVKENILGKRSYLKQIEAKVAKRKGFTLSKQLISKALVAKGLSDDLSDVTVRDLRSIAMSFIPEHDQKIYTFTFRSELSNQTGNISIIVGIMGITFSIFRCLPLHLFMTDTKHVIMYILLIICYLFLRFTRNRFYEISVSAPFSIYTANAIR